VFKVLGGISLSATFGGLFAQDYLGTESASLIVIAGAILGSLNVLIEFFSSFRK